MHRTERHALKEASPKGEEPETRKTKLPTTAPAQAQAKELRASQSSKHKNPSEDGNESAWPAVLQAKELSRVSDAKAVKQVAAEGLKGASRQLPYQEKIQPSFGHHDVSGVKAAVGGKATEATQAIGAVSYASGNQVAFGSTPDLHTAAHEAAHIVQQRAGVSLKDGLGQTGDPYERQADAVADRVVKGQSAEALLESRTSPGSQAAVQTKTVDEQMPENTSFDMLMVSFTIPKTQLTDDWNDLSSVEPTRVHLKLARDYCGIEFWPALRIDIQWPVSDVAWSHLYYDFGSASISQLHTYNTQRFAVSGKSKANRRIKQFFQSVVQGTKLAQKGYNPMTDPDPLATIDSLKANLGKVSSGGGPALGMDDLTNPTVGATIAFKNEIRQEAGNGALAILPGSAHFSVSFDGAVKNLLEIKNRKISNILITSDCIKLQQNGKDVALLKEVRIWSGGRVDVRKWQPLGSAATAASGESFLRLLGHLLSREGQFRLQTGTADIEPHMVDKMAVEKMNAALTASVQQAIRENRHAIPKHDLCLMLGLSG